jgi:uncharacterized protein YggE
MNAFVVLALVMVLPTAAEEVPRRVSKPSIDITAMGELYVVPDEVLVTLSIVTEHEDDLLAAKAENDRRTQKVLAAVEKFRLPKEYICLQCLTMRQEKTPRGNFVSLPGNYEVCRGLEFTLRDFQLLEPLIADCLAAGANRVDGVLFRTTKHRQQQFEARKLAVMFAKEKAEHLASLNGMKVGKAIWISEEVEGDWHTTGGGMGGSLSQDANPRARMHFAAEKKLLPPAAGKPSAAPSIVAPGQIAISATVNITFELLDP